MHFQMAKSLEINENKAVLTFYVRFYAEMNRRKIKTNIFLNNIVLF